MAAPLGLLNGPLMAQPGNEPKGYELERERLEDLPPSLKLLPPKPSPNLGTEAAPLDYESLSPEFEPRLQLPAITAAAVPKPKWETLFPYHARLSFGRYLEPWLQLHAANGRNGRNPRVAWEAFGEHHSALDGPVAESEFVRHALRLKGRYYLDNHTAWGHAHLRHQSFRFYGDTSAVALDELPDSARQRLLQMEAAVGLLRNPHPGNGFGYDAQLMLQHASDRFENAEFHFNLLPNLGYRISPKLRIDLPIRFTYSSLRELTLNAERAQLFLDLAPQVQFRQGALQARAGLRLGVFSNPDGESNTRAYPILAAEYGLLADSLLVPFVELLGQTHYVTRYQLVDQNPWLDPQNSSILPSLEKVRVQGGVRGHWGSFSWKLSLSYRQVENQIVFYAPDSDVIAAINVPLYGRQGYQGVFYESGFNAFGLALEAEYNRSQRYVAGFRMLYESFSLDQLPHYFGFPNLQARVYGTYMLGTKLRLSSHINLVGARPMSLDADGNVVEADLFVDWGLYAEYALSRRFSLFLEGNNLLNATWQRWNGYTERGIDVRGGLSLSF